MEDTPDWIVSTIDNKIVSVSLDYRIFTDIMRSISWVSADSISEIRCTKVPMEEIMRMARTLAWEDLRLFGSDFQKMVWKKLFGLTHREGARESLPDTSGRLSPEEGTGPVPSHTPARGGELFLVQGQGLRCRGCKLRYTGLGQLAQQSE